MKRLLTFIYGLLMFGLSMLLYYKFETTKEWYSWLYLAAFVFLVIDAFGKLDKATE